MRMTIVRQRAGEALVQFAAERSLERQQMERSIIAAADGDAAGQAGALATLAAARWFEQAMLWVGWRLHPQQLTFARGDRLSS